MKTSGHLLTWTRDWPIQRKLMLVIMLTCAVVLLLACGLLGGYQIYKFRDSLASSTTVLADVVAANTQAALAFQDERAAELTLSALRANSYISAACLYDSKGERFATYRREGSTGSAPDQPLADGTHFGYQSLGVVRPVVLNGRRIGSIYLETSLEGLYERLRLFADFSGLVLIISGLVAFGVSARLQGAVSKPIQALTDTARRISVDKDFATRVPPAGLDEVGQLTGALNELLASIEERDTALRRANELLRGEIGDRRQAEKALAESEQRLKALMQALPVGVSFSDDATCEHISGNATLLAQFEASPGDNVSTSSFDPKAHGRHVQFFRDGVAVPASELPLQRAVAEKREIKSFELEVVLPSGRRWFMEGSGAPVLDREGNVIAGVAVTSDISERKAVENTLREIHAQLADRATHLEAVVEQRTVKLRDTIGELEAFSYSIAHDMRAPLRSLQGFAGILLSEYTSKLDAEGQDYLRRIAKSADRMDKLIQDVLSYSRVVRGDFPLEPVDVHQLLLGMIESYPVFEPAKADIVIQDPLPLAMGNEAMLTQIFSNLMGNAVKFVAPGVRPRLKIWAEPRDPFVRYFVEDNGIGIAADQVEKIFAIFQRASKGYEGTGIGLAIVKKAVERMGGKVGVDSRPGGGSVFWIEVQPAP